METAGTAGQLCQALSRFAIGMDLPTFAYIAIPSTTGRQLGLMTNYADPWRRNYVDQRYETSVIVLNSIRRPGKFEWGRDFGGDDLFAQLLRRGVELRHLLRLHHTHSSLARPVRGADLRYGSATPRVPSNHSLLRLWLRDHRLSVSPPCAPQARTHTLARRHPSDLQRTAMFVLSGPE